MKWHIKRATQSQLRTPLRMRAHHTSFRLREPPATISVEGEAPGRSRDRNIYRRHAQP